MAVNKVIYGDTTLIDLTSDTIAADKILQGYTAHDKSGSLIVGTIPDSSGATITVTYNSQFYNKTMTCTKGTKTYTKTTTSSGSTEFKVNDEGTWTITCNGVSRTVDVVLNYTTQMAITKTITVYSAASDTVSFTDATGAKTVTTDASGQGSVAITFIPPSASITFTSSKAKNPNNLSQAYSKTVTISTSTSKVYVMPNNVLYWWGYKSDNIEDRSTANGWSSSRTYQAPTYYTNYVFLNSTSPNGTCGIGAKTAVTLTKEVVISEGISQAYSCYGEISISYSKNEYQDYASRANVLNNSIHKTEASVTSGAYYPFVQSSIGQSQKVYALWYE